MARDYAQSARGKRGASRARSGGGMPGWVWLVAGLSVGLAVAAFVHLQRPMAHGLQGERPPAERPLPPATGAKSGAALKLPPKEKPRFTFYELLPSEEVVVPREDAPKAGKKPGTAPSASYIIQVASYRSREEAEKQKAQLALLGVESRIESVTIDGSETFYRVRVGPLKDYGKVQIITSRLEDNGIQSLVVKVKP